MLPSSHFICPHQTSMSLRGLSSSPASPPTTTTRSPRHATPALQPRAGGPPSASRLSTMLAMSALKMVVAALQELERE